MYQQSIPVRTALMPLCYRDFHCLAAACRDNCCGSNWKIAFNKKDYLRVKRSAKSDELKEILASGISRLRKHELGDTFYAQFDVGDNGKCAFQTEEGLCFLQLECGAAALPYVCRTYPRKSLYTAAAKELSLSPSCEGVLALLWDLPQGIDFWEEPLPKKEWQLVKVPPQLARFADIRSFCVDVIQERSLPLSRRLLLLGLLLQRLKDFDWTMEGVVDEWVAWGSEQLRSPSVAATLETFPRNRLEFLTSNIQVMLGVYENTDTRSKEVYRSLFSALSVEEDWERNGLGKFSIDTIRYQHLEAQLKELLGHMDEFLENLMVMTAFYSTFPNPTGPEELWKSYAALCGLYSFYWFAAVCGCHKEVSRERLFQIIVAASRDLLHNTARLDWLADIVIEDGGTLAKIAVLLGG